MAHALARVGESISASAATVIFALLTLLLASFGLYHDLGVPLALGIAVMLLAGLTLLPALLAVFGRAAFWPSKAIKPLTAGEVERDGWWGRVAARLVARPGRTLAAGLDLFHRAFVRRPGLLLVRVCRRPHRPQRHGRGDRQRVAGQALPVVERQPGQPRVPLRPLRVDGRHPCRQGRCVAAQLRACSASWPGPLNPNGTAILPSQLEALYAKLGPPARRCRWPSRLR